GVEHAHPLLAVSQVERFFLIYFYKGTLPGSKGCALVHIAEQRVACSIIKCIGDDQFYPAIQWHIKGVWVFEVARFALKYQFIHVDAKVTQQAVGNMGMS